MGSHSVTCHLAEVTFPPLPQPIIAGTRFSDPRGMQDWVDLVGLVTYQDGILARRWSPIPVLTGLNVEQLSLYDEWRYHSAKPPSAVNPYRSLITSSWVRISTWNVRIYVRRYLRTQEITGTMCIFGWKCSFVLSWTALWICVILDNEDRRKKITIAIKPVGQNRNDSTDNITDIRNVVQGLRLSPTLQVSSFITCFMLIIETFQLGWQAKR